MTIGKLCVILKSKKGTAFPLVVSITLVLFLFLCTASEGIRLIIIARGVRDSVQSAVISTVNDNYYNVYHSVREGYSGAYQPSAHEFAESLDYGDINNRLDRDLGLMQENGYHVKYAGSNVEYRLSELSVSLQNMPLAPSDPDNTEGFLADTVIRLEVFISFAGKLLPPMEINLRVQAKYIPLF